MRAACSLETSCEFMNVLLDRAVIRGVPGVDGVGFFAGATQLARMLPPFVSGAEGEAEVELFKLISNELDDDWAVIHSLGIGIHNTKA